MKSHCILLLLLSTFTLISCNKDGTLVHAEPNELPPITNTGANTFACKVNGNIWTPWGNFTTRGIQADFFIDNLKNTPIFSILANNRRDGYHSSCTLKIDNIRDTGTYKIRDYPGCLRYSDGVSYEPTDTFGIVHISRFDTIAKIVSGTFSFVGKTNITLPVRDMAKITEGRFDLHYPYVK